MRTDVKIGGALRFFTASYVVVSLNLFHNDLKANCHLASKNLVEDKSGWRTGKSKNPTCKMEQDPVSRPGSAHK